MRDSRKLKKLSLLDFIVLSVAYLESVLILLLDSLLDVFFSNLDSSSKTSFI